MLADSSVRTAVTRLGRYEGHVTVKLYQCNIFGYSTSKYARTDG